jgi:hypothetical protein
VQDVAGAGIGSRELGGVETAAAPHDYGAPNCNLTTAAVLHHTAVSHPYARYREETVLPPN